MINRYQKFFEIKDVEKSVVFDEVDSLKTVEQDGVECLIGDDFMEYQENHESSFDYSNTTKEN